MMINRASISALLGGIGLGLTMLSVVLQPTMLAKANIVSEDDSDDFAIRRVNGIGKKFTFGEPILPDDQPRQNPQASQSPRLLEVLPAGLAEKAEVIVISGYEPSEKNRFSSPTQVVVNRSGQDVLLVLSSYEKVNWKISTTPSTKLRGVIVSDYANKSTVRLTNGANIYHVNLPFSYNLEGRDFFELLKRLHHLLGIEQVQAYRGGYGLEASYTISQPDSENIYLSISGPSVEIPPVELSFDLFDQDLLPIPWTLSGPMAASREVLRPGVDFAMSPNEETLFQVKDDMLQVTEMSSKVVEAFELPSNFPEFSWVSGIAYDSKRDIVSIVSLGGEGYLYRFDAVRKAWIDVRTVNDIDFSTLAYDLVQDRYIGLASNWTAGHRLIQFTGDGDFVSVEPLTTQLPHYSRFRSDSNFLDAPMQIVLQGGNMGVVQYDQNSVSAIWYYDEKAQRGILTYKGQ